jgi:hypothetical protein
MTSGEVLATAGLRPMIAVPSLRGLPAGAIIMDYGALSAPGVRAPIRSASEERAMTHRA